jgi:hypothetical protein
MNAEHYQTLSEKYLAEAREFLGKGDLVQASEKLWGAAALAIKTAAAKRGLKLERHERPTWLGSYPSHEVGSRPIILAVGTLNVPTFITQGGSRPIALAVW